MLNGTASAPVMQRQKFAHTTLFRGCVSALRAIGGLIYPHVCLGCSGRIPPDGPPICHACHIHLERADEEKINEQIDTLPKVHYDLTSIFALWVFDKGGCLQNIQHALKYRNMPSIGHYLGATMATAYLGHLEAYPHLAPPEVVIPIPLSRIRFLERGYNQSAMLAEGMASEMRIEHRPDALIRARATRTQTALKQDARWQNVSGAFRMEESDMIAGRSVLLIDDVLTTGATLLAAAEPLWEAGARAVHGAALCFTRS